MLQRKKFTIDEVINLAALVQEGSDEWVVLLHGLQSNSSLFEKLISDLQRFPLSFLAPDFVGFGESSKPQGFDYDLGSQKRIIEQLVTILGIKSFHIIGHSLGGMVGTLLLDSMANRVRSLITLEGNLTLPDCGASAKVSSLSFDEFQRNFYPSLKQQLKVSNEPSAALRSKGLEIIPDFAFYKTSQSIVKWSRDSKMYQAFSDSTTPRLLIKGADSSFSTKPSGIGLESAEIAGAGHFMLSDNQPQTHEIIRIFLGKHLSV